MIHFELKHIDKVQPAGTDGNLWMSWFWLTDSYLWLDLGNNRLYEYTPEAIEYFGIKQSPFTNYPLVRFIEDLTGLFDQIRESIPTEIYRLTDNLDSFFNDADKWLDIYETDEDEYSDFYFEEYDNLISWTYKRTFDSGHLIGGPHFSFFRCENKLKIIWETEHKLENGIEIWTAKDGSVEVEFDDFIHQIKDFVKSFFEKMDKQVELANEKNWGEIQIDKNQLAKEHFERKERFNQQVSVLEHGSRIKTNWDMVFELYKRMQKEIKTKA